METFQKPSPKFPVFPEILVWVFLEKSGILLKDFVILQLQ